MSNFRFRALDELKKRETKRFHVEDRPLPSYYGEKVFSRDVMRKYLTQEAFDAVVASIDENKKINRKFADQIAGGMKAWALENGVTHYTHWFHPLNEATAEKHESFLEISKEGRPLENFRGELLIQQEPDASSFPSGGLRNTFEARGYTAWDPSSPAFVFEQTLCIPTVFVSYTGEALDFKAPFLKSLTALDKAATAVCQYFDKDVKRVISGLGIEQEYFLVDEALYMARPDLMLTGRTLMGHEASKNQQLDDHYFGLIPSRIAAFMRDVETEANRLGIPLKTRHNEAAPNQYECAPIFEEANLANDHNVLLMSVMKRIAKEHKLIVLFHEKPYKGINGSGKHCNWSLISDKGVNLLSSGKTPRNNLQFLTFFINTIRAVYEHNHLLMSSIANLNNYFRLGAAEAPPAMMSVFAGQMLTDVLRSLEASSGELTTEEISDIKLDVVAKIPEIHPDSTDRNRTSTFAFSGNRFEFRAVGSSSNCASPMIVLNTAVAQQLTRFKADVDELLKRDYKKDEAILQVLRRYVQESKAVLYEGNGYSEDWYQEASRRGLKSINNVPEAFKAYLTSESIKMFEEMNVLTSREIESRYEIKNETYLKKLQIESRVLGDMAINHIIPTAVQYQNVLIENVKGLKDIFGERAEDMASPQIRSLEKLSKYIRAINEEVYKMIDERKIANTIEDIPERTIAYSVKVLPYMESIRSHIDKLEMIIDDELWPMPKYRELLLAL